MALSTILGRSRSASRFINRIYGNLILPSASVPAFRQFSSSSCKDNESLVNDAKQPHESLNDLISKVQALERHIELLRYNSYSQPKESLAQGQGVEESESVHKGIHDDSFDSSLKDMAIETSNDQVEDCESDKSDDDSKDEGKGSDSSEVEDCDKSDDDSKDEGKGSKDEGKGSDSSDDSDSDDNSSDESLSEADDKNENSDHEWLSENGETVPERDENSDENSESGDTLPKPDDESLPKSKENEQLLKEIEAEILRAKTFMELSAPAAVIPKDFPFKIGNRYYSGNILMTQEYEGELVTVYVESPTIFLDRQCNDYNEKKSSSFSMDLTVLVSDLSSKSRKVELKCGAGPEGIYVNSASAPAEAGHEVLMSDVNENLKEEFGKYLEARGITLSTTKFIYGYMLDKTNKERLRILENIQKKVSA